MEPQSLTCAKCGTSWKLVKAGTGPVVCPNCSAPISGIPGKAKSTETKPAEPPVPASAPVATVEPPTPPTPAPPVVPPTEPTNVAIPFSDFSDADDPGLKADYDDRPDGRRRSGMPPLLKTLIILLILMILLPLALFLLFAVVCAILFAGR